MDQSRPIWTNLDQSGPIRPTLTKRHQSGPICTKPAQSGPICDNLDQSWPIWTGPIWTKVGRCWWIYLYFSIFGPKIHHNWGKWCLLCKRRTNWIPISAVWSPWTNSSIEDLCVLQCGLDADHLSSLVHMQCNSRKRPLESNVDFFRTYFKALTNFQSWFLLSNISKDLSYWFIYF